MGRRGRLKISLEMWAKIGVKPGDTVELTVTENGALEFKKYSWDLDDQIGSVSVEGRQDFEKVREEMKKKREDKKGK